MLYQPDDNVAIYTPPRTGAASLLAALKPTGWISTNHIHPNANPVRILLMRHPESWIQSQYKQYENSRPGHVVRLPYKTWMRSKAPPAQFTYCDDPDCTIRLEHLHNDLIALGLTFLAIPHMNQSPPRDLPSCLATRAFIRRTYIKDFELGDYE